MATNLLDSVSTTSDVCHDYSCSLCELDELNKKATYQCEKCDKYFCDSCEKMHAKLHRDHEVLGRENLRLWNGGKTAVAMETCEYHAGKEKEMECFDHDTFCCTICVSKYHRSCQHVEYIPDVAKGITKKPVFAEFPDKASNLTTLLQTIIERKKTNRNALAEAREEMASAISDLQIQMNEAIEGLKQKTDEEMESQLAKIDEALQDDIEVLTEADEDVKNFTKTISYAGKDDQTAIYLGLRKFETKVSQATSVVQQVTDDEDLKISFAPNANVWRFLSSLRSLGTIEVAGFRKNIFRPRKVPKVVQQGTKSVRDEGDSMTCDIGGLCHLPSGHFAAVDWANNNVKLLNDQLEVMDTYKMPKYPQKVCKVSDCEIAVSVCCGIADRNEIHFLVIKNDKLVFQKKLTRHHSCHGIGYQFPNLYIASFTAIYSHSNDGFISKVYEDTSDEKTTGRIALSDDGKRIYTINTSKHQVLALDQDGKVESRLEYPDLKEPIDIAIADDGGLFACYRRSPCIAYLNTELRDNFVTIATISDGMHYPRSIVVDKQASRLIVGQNSDEILVLNIK